MYVIRCNKENIDNLITNHQLYAKERGRTDDGDFGYIVFVFDCLDCQLLFIFIQNPERFFQIVLRNGKGDVFCSLSSY